MHVIFTKSRENHFSERNESGEPVTRIIYHARREDQHSGLFYTSPENPALIQEYDIWEVPKETGKK